VYKINKQMSIEDFIFPYGKLKSSNRWVLMAGLIPWDDIERDYAEGFVNNGAPAHPARMALGSLIIKQILGCSDEELICQVAENPYLQFFIGLKEFSEECPFGASTLVAFRRSFTEKDIAKSNGLMLGWAREEADDDDSDDDEDGNEKTRVTRCHSGTFRHRLSTRHQAVKRCRRASGSYHRLHLRADRHPKAKDVQKDCPQRLPWLLLCPYSLGP